MTSLAPMQVFRDIAVAPTSAVSGHVALGGPVWPEFGRQTAARHCRDRLAVDACPPRPLATRSLRQPAVWGGFLDLQFGHLIAEHLTRLPQSVNERPEDIYLFTLAPGQTEASLPDWVWQILDWHGVRRDKVRLVAEPLTVAELAVAAQGEMMGRTVTDSAYLDMLDRNAKRRALAADPWPVVFVTRAGMVARGHGGHAGEGYLAEVLAKAGVRVIDPALHAVAVQLAIYAGARALVFAEGSAIHGRQLLGRVGQDIHVLRRRPKRDTAAAQLAPRCRELYYHPTVGLRLGARMPGGRERPDLSAALYDLDVVFGLFARLGRDLRPSWDEAEYRAAVGRDVQGWLANCRTAPAQRAHNLSQLADAGYAPDTLTMPLPVPLHGAAPH